jgi:hypothetical protein
VLPNAATSPLLSANLLAPTTTPGSAITASVLSGGQLVNANVNGAGLNNVLGSVGSGQLGSLLPGAGSLGGSTHGPGGDVLMGTGGGSAQAQASGPLGNVVASLTGSGSSSSGGLLTPVTSKLTAKGPLTALLTGR